MQSESISFTISGSFLTNLCRQLNAEGNREKALKILDESFDEISIEQAELICDGKLSIIDSGDGMLELAAENEEYKGLLESMNVQKMKPLDAWDF